MRLSRTVVAERDEFIKNLVRENSSLTGGALQKALVEKFGKKMNPGRLYKLRNNTIGELTSRPVVIVRQ